MNDQPAVRRLFSVIAVRPDAGEALEVGGAETAAVLVLPEAQRHRRERFAADQLALAFTQPLTFVVPHLDRHTQALALQLATPDRRGRIAEGEAGDDVGAAGDRRQAQIRFEAAVDVIKTLVRQRRTGRQHRLQPTQLVAAIGLDAGLFQRGQILGASAENTDVLGVDQVDQPLRRRPLKTYLRCLRCVKNRLRMLIYTM